MISIAEHVSLLPFNTFGVDVQARYFCRIKSLEELQELISTPVYQRGQHLMLGSGSNMLFTRDVEGLVIHDEMKGISVIDEDDNNVTVKACAGVLWHDLVMYCVANDWGGIENLSLIPGTVGAAPIQNIGAYGVEVATSIKEVEGIDVVTGVLHRFNRDECRFGYRESAFKGDWNEKYFISSVTLSLTKKNHIFHIAYGAIQDTLKQMRVTTLSVKGVSDAVIRIRQSKLPDPAVVGNAGSFFKNPSVSREHFALLQQAHPGIPSYPSDNQKIKLAAGWLIEQCGWKGKRINNVGVHPQQALVLVNFGGGTGKEIFALATQIQSSVKEKFDVVLTPEVNIF